MHIIVITWSTTILLLKIILNIHAVMPYTFLVFLQICSKKKKKKYL